MGIMSKLFGSKSVANPAAEAAAGQFEAAKQLAEKRAKMTEETPLEWWYTPEGLEELYQRGPEEARMILGESEGAKVFEDARRLKEEQKSRSIFEQMTEQGVTPEQREAVRSALEQAVAADTASRNKMMADMAATGQLPSAGLLAQMQASNQQQRSQQQRQTAMDLAGMVREGQMAGAKELAGLADVANRRSTGLALDKARMADTGAMNQFNTDVARQNREIERTRQIMDLKAGMQEEQKKSKAAAGLNRLQAANQMYGNVVGAQQAQGNAMFNAAQMRTTKPGLGQTLLTIGGGVAGGLATGGSPQGIMLGSQAGSAVGGGIGSQYNTRYADGGVIEAADGYGGYMPNRATAQNQIPSLDQVITKPTSGASLADLKMADELMLQNKAKTFEDANKQVEGRYENAKDSLDSGPSRMDQLGAILKELPKNEPQQSPKLSSVSESKWSSPELAKHLNMARSMPIKRADGGMAYKDGGYEHDGTGAVVPGESYSGDKVPAKVNSEEMILNLEQQDRINGIIQERNDLLKELKRLKSGDRMDVAVDNGEAAVNKKQQSALFDVIRGAKSAEELPEDSVLEQLSMDELSMLLSDEE